MQMESFFGSSGENSHRLQGQIILKWVMKREKSPAYHMHEPAQTKYLTGEMKEESKRNLRQEEGTSRQGGGLNQSRRTHRSPDLNSTSATWPEPFLTMQPCMMPAASEWYGHKL